jgi:hypothetical protein
MRSSKILSSVVQFMLFCRHHINYLAEIVIRISILTQLLFLSQCVTISLSKDKRENKIKRLFFDGSVVLCAL